MWLYSAYKPGEVIPIESLGVEIATEQLYRNVRLDTSERPEDES